MEIGDRAFGEWMSLTDIQQYLMMETKFNYLNTQRIGSILTALGYIKERKLRGNSKITMYFVSKLAG
jgi:CTP:phosphocholine cytidylyltransferase-like protein